MRGEKTTSEGSSTMTPPSSTVAAITFSGGRKCVLSGGCRVLHEVD